MTFNIPASVFNIVIAAFLLVVILGIAIGAYAASSLKKREGDSPKE